MSVDVIAAAGGNRAEAETVLKALVEEPFPNGPIGRTETLLHAARIAALLGDRHHALRLLIRASAAFPSGDRYSWCFSAHAYFAESDPDFERVLRDPIRKTVRSVEHP